MKCGHTFCKECQKALHKNKRIKCPLDKKQFDYFLIDDIGKNFIILDLLEAERQVKREPDEYYCEMHPHKKVKFFCNEHDSYICSDCYIDQHIDHKDKVDPAKPKLLGK